MDIPEQWQSIELDKLEGLVMILGGPDMGKSTFSQYLYEQFLTKPTKTAFIDGDPGQSRLGPPTTMTLSFDSRLWRVFVGSTSPVKHMLPMLVGAARLVDSAKKEGAHTIIYDTTGLIDEGQGGVSLKQAKIDLLRPNAVIALQRGKELETILAPFRKRGRIRIIDLKPSLAIQPRNMYMRRRYRRLQFTRYFADSQKMTLNWHKFAVFPKPFFTTYGLIALEDQQGFTQALAIVLEVWPKDHKLTIFSPLKTLDGIKALRTGDIIVDPMSFEDQKRSNYYSRG